MKLAAKFTPKPVGGLVRGASEFNCSTLNTNTTTEQIKIKSLKKNMMTRMTKESGLKSGSAERGVGSEFQVGGSLNTRRQSENTNCDDHICDKVKIQTLMIIFLIK